MSDEFDKHDRGLPSKDIRFNQGHDTNPRMAADSRWKSPDPRMVKTKPPCTKITPAPAFKQGQYRHADFRIKSAMHATVTLECRWCGHQWKEPR